MDKHKKAIDGFVEGRDVEGVHGWLPIDLVYYNSFVFNEKKYKYNV